VDLQLAPMRLGELAECILVSRARTRERSVA
jgi:hypothetical protein